MASLVTSIAGQYTSTINIASAGVVALGINQDGWQLNTKFFWQVLNRTDKFGQSPIEGFFQGLSMNLSTVLHEWKAQELKLQTIVNDTMPATGATVWSHGLVGSQATDSGGILVLTPVALTPAATNGPATMTFHSVTVSEDFSLDWNFGPDKLVMPFMGRVWPVTDGSGGAKYYTGT